PIAGYRHAGRKQGCAPLRPSDELAFCSWKASAEQPFRLADARIARAHLTAHLSLLRRRTVLRDPRQGVPRVIGVLDGILSSGQRKTRAFEFPARRGG